MTPDDLELIERVVERDAEAFAALFKRYQEPVRRRVRQIVRDPVAADDVVQEVFLRLWNRVGQWSGQGPFAAWLLRIAANAALTQLRAVRRRREERLELSQEVEGDAPSAPEWLIEAASQGPDVQVEREDQRRWLRQQVEELSEDQREVFRLVYEAQVEVRQAAAQLGIPEGTAKSRLHHGRREIARAWREMEKKEEES